MTHLCVWPQWSQVTFEVPTCHQLHDNQCRLALRNNTKQPNLAEEKQMFSTNIQVQLIIIYSCWYVGGTCGKGLSVDLVPLSDWGFMILQSCTELKIKSRIPTSVRADMPRTASCQWAPGLDEPQPRHIFRTHHMVTVELLHHRGLVQELDPLAHARRLIDRLDGHPGLWLILHHSLGYSLVHHPKGALPKLPAHGDLLPGHLPLVWNIHWGEREQERTGCDCTAPAGITPCCTTATAPALLVVKPHAERWDFALCVQTALSHTEHTNQSERKVDLKQPHYGTDILG